MSPDSSDDRPPGDDISPIGEGFTWVARITGVGLVMTLPAVAGSWLDTRLGTGFLTPAGLVVGFVIALAWIVGMAGTAPKGGPRRRRRPDSKGRNSPP